MPDAAPAAPAPAGGDRRACPRCAAALAPGARFCPACGAPVPGGDAPDTLRDRLAAAVADDYEVLGLLGRGGMAVVYLAWDRGLARHAALKVLRPELADDPAMARRFLQEGRTAAGLDAHPGVVRVYAAKEAAGLRYLAMQYVDGCSLEALLRARGALPADLAADLVDQLARALDYAHARAVVHRDVKPANVLLARDGAAAVADFGIATLALRAGPGADTRDVTGGAGFGTPAYMSPEHWRGEPLTAASDQYALGVVGYHLVAGRVPFGGPIAAMADGHRHAEPPPLQPPAGAAPDGAGARALAALAPVVARMLAKRAEDRFPSLRAVSEALAAVPRDEPAVLRVRVGRLVREAAAARDHAPVPASAPAAEPAPAADRALVEAGTVPLGAAPVRASPVPASPPPPEATPAGPAAEPTVAFRRAEPAPAPADVVAPGGGVPAAAGAEEADEADEADDAPAGPTAVADAYAESAAGARARPVRRLAVGAAVVLAAAAAWAAGGRARDGRPPATAAAEGAAVTPAPTPAPTPAATPAATPARPPAAAPATGPGAGPGATASPGEVVASVPSATLPPDGAGTRVDSGAAPAPTAAAEATGAAAPRVRRDAEARRPARRAAARPADAEVRAAANQLVASVLARDVVRLHYQLAPRAADGTRARDFLLWLRSADRLALRARPTRGATAVRGGQARVAVRVPLRWRARAGPVRWMVNRDAVFWVTLAPADGRWRARTVTLAGRFPP